MTTPNRRAGQLWRPPEPNTTSQAGSEALLANVAAQLRSSDALTAGRPGSWETDLVEQLTKGTVGWGDEYLADYGEPLP